MTEPRKPPLVEDVELTAGEAREFDDLFSMCLQGWPPWKVWMPRIARLWQAYQGIVAKLREQEEELALVGHELRSLHLLAQEQDAKLREAERELKELHDTFNICVSNLRAAERERDEAIARGCDEQRQYLRRRAERAEARAGRLVEALRPFAEAAELILSSKKAPIETDAELVVIPDTGACDFTMADLIRARDALLEARREKSLPEEPFGDSRPPTKGELDELHRAVRKQQARREET